MKNQSSLQGIALALCASLVLSSLLLFGPMTSSAVADNGGGTTPPVILPPDTSDPGHVSQPSEDTSGVTLAVLQIFLEVLF